jgi:hypothetical protein
MRNRHEFKGGVMFKVNSSLDAAAISAARAALHRFGAENRRGPWGFS